MDMQLCCTNALFASVSIMRKMRLVAFTESEGGKNDCFRYYAVDLKTDYQTAYYFLWFCRLLHINHDA